MSGSRKWFELFAMAIWLAPRFAHRHPLIMEIGVTWFAKWVKWFVRVCHDCKVLFSMHQMLLFCAVCAGMFQHGCGCDHFASLLKEP